MDRETAFAALKTLYKDLECDIVTLGLDCAGCGRCCHFEEFDHILFTTGLEYEYLLSVEKKMTPDSPDRCPYQVNEKCLARKGRPLGCRLFFCQAEKKSEELSEQYHRKLRELHELHGIEWVYRPLLEWLERG